MSIRPIVQLALTDVSSRLGVLREPCVKVDTFNDDLRSLFADLIETLKAHRIAVGLAAPQIGIAQRVAVVSPEEGAEILVLCNPVVVGTSGKKGVTRESCMSLPGVGGRVERRHKVRIAYQSDSGEDKTLEATGFLARIIAHEVDHLNGVLYVDRMADPSALEVVDVFDRD